MTSVNISRIDEDLSLNNNTYWVTIHFNSKFSGKILLYFEESLSSFLFEKALKPSNAPSQKEITDFLGEIANVYTGILMDKICPQQKYHVSLPESSLGNCPVLENISISQSFTTNNKLKGRIDIYLIDVSLAN